MLRLDQILFARDFSPASERALPYALTLARRLHATLAVVYVDTPHGRVPADHPAADANLRDRLVGTGTDAEGQPVPTEGMALQPVVVRDVAPAPGILAAARARDADLIVLGTHGHRGLRHLLLGSTAEEVVRHAPCPVLTVGRSEAPADAFARLDTLVVPVDFSRHAEEAVHYAKELAACFGARVELLHVVDDRLSMVGVDAALVRAVDLRSDGEIRTRMQRFYQHAGGPGVPQVRTAVRRGNPAEEIVAYAGSSSTHMIVMSTHGLTGLSHLLLGSVAEHVVRLAACPVFAVKSFGKSLLRDAQKLGAAAH